MSKIIVDNFDRNNIKVVEIKNGKKTVLHYCQDDESKAHRIAQSFVGMDREVQ